MATVTFVGRQETRQQVSTLTVGSSTAGQTFTVTAGVKVVTYTAVTGDTTSTIASALQGLLNASTEGEFKELAWAAPSANVFTATGPSDGAPFTITAGGTGTLTIATTVAPLSPSDLGDGLNYSTGALPSAGDALVFENSGQDAKYNADALAAIALGSVTRRATHTGLLGLPVQNPAGYVEYRVSEVQLKCVNQTYETGQTDQAGEIRINTVTTSPVTLTILGDGTSTQIGSEVVTMRGLPASSVVSLNGSSLSLATLAGQVATVATLSAQNSTVWCGPGVTLGAAALDNCTSRFDCSWTTLALTTGGACDVRGAAAGGAAGLSVYGATVTWRSTGATGNSPVIGTGGVIDFSQSPASVTVGGTVEVNAGATWNDPVAKVARPYDILLNRCKVTDVAINVGTGRTLAVS